MKTRRKFLGKMAYAIPTILALGSLTAPVYANSSVLRQTDTKVDVKKDAHNTHDEHKNNDHNDQSNKNNLKKHQ
jgi:hypothetical protein